MCCDNPIDLGCISSCDDLVLPVAITTSHTIKTTFNGTDITLSFTLVASDHPKVSKTYLNEDYIHTLVIYDASGVEFKCYRLSITPGVGCCGETITPTTCDVCSGSNATTGDVWTKKTDGSVGWAASTGGSGIEETVPSDETVYAGSDANTQYNYFLDSNALLVMPDLDGAPMTATYFIMNISTAFPPTVMGQYGDVFQGFIVNQAPTELTLTVRYTSFYLRPDPTYQFWIAY